MVTGALRSLWEEPRVPAPAGVPWWDRVLVAVLVPAALVEGLVRDDVPWPAFSIALAVVCPLALLGRRRHPLAMLLLAFGAQAVAGVAPALAGRGDGVLYVTACVLLLPYSLARWGSGRHVVAGVVWLSLVHVLRELLYGAGTASILAGLGFLMLPVAVGAAVRFYAGSRRREAEQVRLRERQQLARELHDTIAHHVSGIVVQAQAGRAVAAADPQRALGVLPAIEAAATRSLAEMRSVVGILRDGAPAERAPAQGVADLDRLAGDGAGGADVRLSLTGDLADLAGPVDAAVYRIVQESLTNAKRHAVGATHVEVDVSAGPDTVRVSVRDDGRGEGGRAPRGTGGYGLVGMAERVEALGGTLQAGPRPGAGWGVAATIPRRADAS